MLASIPAGLWEEWKQFDQLEPISPHSQTQVIAELASAVFSYMGCKMENGELIEPKHLMPWLQLTQRKSKKQGYVTQQEADRQIRDRNAR